MSLVVCYKLSPDSRDIKVNADFSLSFDKAEWLIGDFDLVAIEAAAQISAITGDSLIGLSVGTESLKGSKSRKNALSRGIAQLLLVQDNSLAGGDTHKIASVLTAAIKTVADCKLVVCGEGSADLYCQQTGLQVGELLGIPTINGISKVIRLDEQTLVAERTTDDVIETVEIPLPAAITVTADFAQARVPKLSDIMAASKKPIQEVSLAELGSFNDSTNIISIKAPPTKARKGILIEEPPQEAASTLIAHLTKEGII